MKNIKLVWLFVCFIIICATSCHDFDELNTDPNRLEIVNPGSFLNPILYEMTTYNWNRANSYTFDLMQVSTPTNSLGGVSRYFIGDAAGNGSWSAYYKWLNNAKEMEKQAIALKDPNYEAIAIVLQSWSLQLLTDCFGDIPMTEACKAEEGLLQPKFDNQKLVYKTLIDRLEEANTKFDMTKGLQFNTSGELLYKTDKAATNIIKWRKFCNSLRLRILLRVLSKDTEIGATTKIKEMFADPDKYPIFASNADGALLELSGVFPEEPPMTRPVDFTAYRAVTSFFIDNLNKWEDPRRPLFCTTVKDPVTNANIYVGWPSGYAIAPSYSASNLNQNLAKAPLKIVVMSYAEVEFIKAELAIKNIIPTLDAEMAYKKGVEATITQWGTTVPTGFFDRPGMKFNNTFEQIMLQKYFALFFCDYQQWFEYLRTGYPVLPIGDGVPTGNKMPNRFRYPDITQRTNMPNYKLAVENMGGDEFSTKLWWQK